MPWLEKREWREMLVGGGERDLALFLTQDFRTKLDATVAFFSLPLDLSKTHRNRNLRTALLHHLSSLFRPLCLPDLSLSTKSQLISLWNAASRLVSHHFPNCFHVGSQFPDAPSDEITLAHRGLAHRTRHN